MSFLSPKTELPSNLADNTPGRSSNGSPNEVLPMGMGRCRCIVRWQTPVLNWKFRNTSTSSFAFFSCYGWISLGPVDEINEILVGGKAYNGVFAFRESSPGDYIDHVLSKETPETFRFWWGTETQANYSAYLNSLVLDPTHAMYNKRHPSYKGIFAVAIKDMEAGRADGGVTPSLPQIEVVFHRRSVTGYSFGYAAHGTHPIGIVKDLLTLKRGGAKISGSYFNDDHWNNQMQRIMDVGVAGMKGTDLFISPVIDAKGSVGDKVSDILSYIDGHIRERNGKLEIDWMPSDGSTTATEGLTQISKHQRAGELEQETPDIEDVKTKVTVTGLDWTTQPQLSEASADEQVPYAVKLLGEQRPGDAISRPYFVTVQQLKSYAKMQAAIVAAPSPKFSDPVLLQYAVHPDGITPLRPGDRYWLLDDKKGLSLVVRITERSDDNGVRVVLKSQAERGAFPQPYQAPIDPRVDITQPAPADLARYAIAQLPPDLNESAGDLLCALVERPNTSAASFEVQMSPSNTWPGQTVQSGNIRFATAAVLRTALAISYADATITVDTVGIDWSYLRSMSGVEQGDDQLLLYIADEWFSVGTITPLGGGSYTLGMKRARLGSLPAVHAIGTTVFLIGRDDIVDMSHVEFSNVEVAGVYNAATAKKWFKLRSRGTGGVLGNYTAAFSLTLRDPTPAAVADLTARTGTGKIVELRWSPVTSSLVGEYHIYRATGPSFADEAEIGQVDGSRFYDIGVVVGTQYRYRLKAETTNEFVSAWSNAVFATPGVVTGGDVDNTPPSNPGLITLASNGAYLGGDGTVYSYCVFNVPALPAGAVGQTIKRRRAGATGAGETVGQVSNSGVATTIRQDDMTPGTYYDFGLEAFSFSGIASALVLGSGSPYLAPLKNTGPTAPSGLALDSTGQHVNSKMTGGSGKAGTFAVEVKWNLPIEVDVINGGKVEWVRVFNFLSDGSPGANLTFQGVEQHGFLPPSQNYLVNYRLGVEAEGTICVRYWNTSGLPSAWMTISTAGQWKTYLGTIAGDDKTAVSIFALQVGASGASSVRQIVAKLTTQHVVNLAGGAPTEDIPLDISGRGFTTKPTSGQVSLTNPPDKNLQAIYFSGSGSNSSTTAVLRVYTLDGTAIPGGLREFSVFLEQYT